MSTILGCDIVTESTAVMLEDAALIHHDTWVARALALAAADGKRFVLATPLTSVITTGLAVVLDLADANWVVTPEAEDGLPFDGLSGAELAWDGDAYVTTGRQADHFLTVGAEDRGGIVVEAEALRPAKRSTTVGGLSEAVSTVLTGRAPDGWGVLEPVTEPWDIRALSKRYISDRSPQNFVHAVTHDVPGGGDLVCALRIERPRRGVVERVSVATPTQGPASQELREAFVETMSAQGVRWARLSHVVGFDPSMRVPRYTGVPVPSVAVFGPEAVKEIGIDAALEAAKQAAGPEGRAMVVGQGKRAGIAVFYSHEPVPGRNAAVDHLRLTAALIGDAAEDEVAATLGLSPDSGGRSSQQSPQPSSSMSSPTPTPTPTPAPSAGSPSQPQAAEPDTSLPSPPSASSAEPLADDTGRRKQRGRRAARPGNEPPA